jgi:uncharacterized protein
MQPETNLEQDTVERIFDAHLALMCTDIQAWSDLLAENIAVEFPYAPALGAPSRLEGKSAVYSHVKAAMARMPNLTFTKVRKYPTLNPNVLWAEMHGETITATTGRQYQQDYVVRMETKDGKAIYYCEYWNPVPVMDDWGDIRNFSAE